MSRAFLKRLMFVVLPLVYIVLMVGSAHAAGGGL